MNNSKSRRRSESELTSSGSSKRRKFDLLDHENVGALLKSDCDLKVELVKENETSISSNDNGFSREETSASSEICLDSNEMESTSSLKKKPVVVAVVASSCRKRTKASSIPSAAEIDEFFAQAEKKEQKRFADKYNYDIVNDVPMEGRYQWIRLKP